jgi:hypothetical protein
MVANTPVMPPSWFEYSDARTQAFSMVNSCECSLELWVVSAQPVRATVLKALNAIAVAMRIFFMRSLFYKK